MSDREAGDEERVVVVALVELLEEEIQVRNRELVGAKVSQAVPLARSHLSPEKVLEVEERRGVHHFAVGHAPHQRNAV